MITNPIFIVGTERSGSNLLRLLLNELPEVTVPHPPHLMRDLTPRLSGYGDLNKDKNFRNLIDDAARLVELHFAPWPITLNRNQIFTQAPARDLYSVYAGIYEQYRLHIGKPRWACKSTFIIHHVPEVLKHHAQPQFIHLVRDPRDVAVSAKRSVFCHYHPYFVAQLWRKEQALAARWRSQLPKETWLTVRYEDLIRDPKSTMEQVSAFLGTSFKPEHLDYFKNPTAKNLSALSRSWENVGKPVLSENSQKFLKELSGDEIALIENVAREEMIAFGYPTNSSVSSNVDTLKILKFHAQENWLMWREEGRSLLKDKNAKFRLRKKAFLWKLSLQKMGIRI